MKEAILAALLACALAVHAAPAPYLIESEFQPARAYVGAEMTLRLRLLRAPGVPYGVLRPPRLGDAVELTPFGIGRSYETRRAGATYEVRERTYLVVPRRAGPLVLPGPELDGPLRYAKEFVREIHGAPRVLEVRPPRVEAGEPWLPARRVTLEESWSRDPGALAAGTPVVRTLVVRAEGISGDRLPRLEMGAQPRLRAHYDQSDFSTEYLEAGVAGRRVQRVVLMPLEEGEIGLPELALSWWDVAADAPRTATLAARTLRVAAAEVAEAAPEAPAGVSPQAVMRGFAIAILVLSAAVLWGYLRTQPLREARRQLRAACGRKNPLAVRDALVEWWKAAARGAPAPLVQRMGAGWDERASVQLAALDAALYGGQAWDGKAFWRGMRPWLRKGTLRRAAPVSPALPPLFRLQAQNPRVSPGFISTMRPPRLRLSSAALSCAGLPARIG